MAPSRKPGPLGWGGVREVIDEGTLCRQLSSRPGPIGTYQAPDPNTGLPSAHWFGNLGPSLPFLRQGDRGDNVKKLQMFLNFRLDLRPPLGVDGYFRPTTRKAVVEFQTSRSIKEGGKVGKATWYHLITGTPAIQIQANLPVPQPGRAGGTTPAPKPGLSPWRPPVDSVMDWSLQKKLEYVVDRIRSNLPVESRMQFGGLVPAQSLSVMLVAMADSELFDVAKLPGHARISSPGGQAIFELAHPTQVTALATTESELDKAAVFMAKEIEKIGVAELLSALAKCELVEGGRIKAEERRAPKAPPAKPPAPSKVPLPPLAFDAPKTWIEIQLVDEDGKPVPGQNYRVTTPDGTVCEGTVDEDGLVRITNIDPGTCKFTFPYLDQDAWTPSGR